MFTRHSNNFLYNVRHIIGKEKFIKWQTKERFLYYRKGKIIYTYDETSAKAEMSFLKVVAGYRMTDRKHVSY
jgi:hypothetical protein